MKSVYKVSNFDVVIKPSLSNSNKNTKNQSYIIYLEIISNINNMKGENYVYIKDTKADVHEPDNKKY